MYMRNAAIITECCIPQCDHRDSVYLVIKSAYEAQLSAC